MGNILERRDSKPDAKPANGDSRVNHGNRSNRATASAAELIRSTPAPAAKNAGDMNTIVKCRWCGGKIDEIYLPEFAKGRNGKPCSIIKDYNPCPECQKQWSTAVVIIEVIDRCPYPDCLPIETNEDTALYPTGRHVGIREDVAKQYIDSNCRNGMIFFMTNDTFSPIFQKNFDKITQDILSKNQKG